MAVLGTPPTSKDSLLTRAGKTLRVPARTKCSPSPLYPPSPPLSFLVLVSALFILQSEQSVDPCCAHTFCIYPSTSQKHLLCTIFVQSRCAPPLLAEYLLSFPRNSLTFWNFVLFLSVREKADTISSHGE